MSRKSRFRVPTLRAGPGMTLNFLAEIFDCYALPILHSRFPIPGL